MRATVHTYRSGETGLFVNSYVVEGEEGVVAIDAPLLVSDGRAFRARRFFRKEVLTRLLRVRPRLSGASVIRWPAMKTTSGLGPPESGPKSLG